MSFARAPVISPFFLQYERYPYLRGPNYVRPMFREHGPGGNFKSTPIEVPLLGLGDVDIPGDCWDLSARAGGCADPTLIGLPAGSPCTFKQAHREAFAIALRHVEGVQIGNGATCRPGQSMADCEKEMLDYAIEAAIKRFKCERKGATPKTGSETPKTGTKTGGQAQGGMLASIMKDPIKLGLVVVIGAVVVTQLMKKEGV